jgi:hypothetical protein
MLVMEVVSSGANAIGRASYASGLGEYYTAFFGFSLGIERLAKLCLIVDYALEHNGTLPSQSLVKGYGHSLAKLIKAVQEIPPKHGLRSRFAFPNLPICYAIVECLDTFADARKGRYANFDALGNPSFDVNNEPLAKWWQTVAQPILEKHFNGTKAHAKAKQNAAVIDAMVSSFAVARFTTESGQLMDDIEAASFRTAETKVVQMYGRYYTLMIVRWLASTFAKLADEGSLRRRMPALFGHSEIFYTFTTEDEFLKHRKIWPLNRG